MAATPLGLAPIAATQLGNATSFIPLTSHTHRQTGTLPLHFTVGAHTSGALKIAYHVLGKQTQSLALHYRVVPHLLRCTVNNLANFPAPEQITYTVTQPIYDLSGRPMVQGYLSLTWAWETLTNSEIAIIMQTYNPANPQVQVTYPTEQGEWVSQIAMFEPPNLGTRTTFVQSNVQLTFSHLPLR